MKPTLILLISFSFLSPVLFAEEIDLLAGNNLDQWYQRKSADDSKGWSLDEEGNLHLVPKAGNISTRQSFDNFEFSFEWKVSKGANSGVFYRQAKGQAPEYQVLDDEFHVRGKMTRNRAAELYDLFERADNSCVKKHGEWNTGKIVANGNEIEHWLNGVKVVDVTVGNDEWNQRWSKSKFAKDPKKNNPLFAKQKGRIALQDHGGEVWYRNLKIRELN